jgi:hypothetical protein
LSITSEGIPNNLAETIEDNLESETTILGENFNIISTSLTTCMVKFLNQLGILDKEFFIEKLP